MEFCQQKSCLQRKAWTVLVDSDPNRSVCGWATNGSLPLEVNPLYHAARRTREFEHVVVDTNASLGADEFKEAAAGSDLLIIFKTGIRRFVAYQKAALAGVPVYKAHDPRGRGSLVGLSFGWKGNFERWEIKKADSPALLR